MAYQSVKTPAPGNAANTGAPGPTPAPTVKEKTFGRTNYGANAFDGPSSITPGKSVTSPLADDLRRASNDGEFVLDTVIARGTRMDSPDFQMRSISDAGYPPAHGMKNPTAPGITVPNPPKSLGGNNSDFAAKLSNKQHGR